MVFSWIVDLDLGTRGIILILLRENKVLSDLKGCRFGLIWHLLIREVGLLILSFERLLLFNFLILLLGHIKFVLIILLIRDIALLD